jgi:hypothetical protein
MALDFESRRSLLRNAMPAMRTNLPLSIHAERSARSCRGRCHHMRIAGTSAGSKRSSINNGPERFPTACKAVSSCSLERTSNPCPPSDVAISAKDGQENSVKLGSILRSTNWICSAPCLLSGFFGLVKCFPNGGSGSVSV